MSDSGQRKLRVAVAQINSKTGDFDGNFQKHLDYIALAQKEKADVLMFPELSLSGSDLGNDTWKLARRVSDPMFRELEKASSGMAAVVGFAEEGYAAQFYNSAIILQDGQDPFVHRKMNLCTYGCWTEAKYFAQGRYLESFRLPASFTGALLICADMWNPALVHLASLRAATVLMAPIASAHDAVSSEFSNPDNWKLTLKFYAMMYGMPIVMCNHVGRDGELDFWGGSCIVDAFGNTGESLGAEEGLLVGDLDYADVRRARFELPTVRDSNFALIQRELQRIVVDLGVPVGIREEEHRFGRTGTE